MNPITPGYGCECGHANADHAARGCDWCGCTWGGVQGCTCTGAHSFAPMHDAHGCTHDRCTCTWKGVHS